MAASAIAVALRRRRGDKSAQIVGCKSQGGVEGVRIMGGWSSGSAAVLHKQLDGCRTGLVAEGVLQMSYLVPKGLTPPSEEFELNRGTTENSYLLYDPDSGLAGDGPVLLIDLPEQRFTEAFLKEVSPYLARLEGLVITSIDNENAELVSVLADEVSKAGGASKLTVFCCASAVKIIKACVQNLDALEHVEFSTINDDSYIPCPRRDAPPDADTAPRLDVVRTSTAKIPESLNIFDERTGLLFSGKFFSAHVLHEDQGQPVRAEATWEEFAEDWHHFFDSNFFTIRAQDAVRRIFQIAADNSADGVGIASADVKTIAPRHGPIIDGEAWKLMAKYEAWLERKLSTASDGSALIMYASAYNNTATMADAVAKGLKAKGVKATMMNLEFCEAGEVKSALAQCDAVAIGSPTLGGEMPIQVKEALGVLLQHGQGGNQQGTSLRMQSFSTNRMPCGVFGSYGWSGEAVDEIAVRLKDGGFELGFDPLRCKFKPTEEVIGQCEAAGTQLAQKMTLLKQERAQAVQEAEAALGKAKLERKTEEVSGLKKAFGQIINASCILTMPTEEGVDPVRMPVSWVSQASFVPPGLMLSVEKANLDPFLQQSPEEQMNQLFQKYDKDGSGELDRSEIDPMLDELLGAEAGSMKAETLKAEKNEAWSILDADGSGIVDEEEFRSAAKSGPFASMLEEQRRVASLQAMIGGHEDAAVCQDFVLSMLPVGMTTSDAMRAELVPNKAKNGCPIIKGCTAFVECSMKDVTDAGRGTLLYAEVKLGQVMDKDADTELLRADHVPVEHQSTEEAGAPEEVDAPEGESLAMAALGGAAPAARPAGRSCLAGASAGAA